MNRIMLDLETLDITPTATILSIGAVFFDEGGLVAGVSKFYQPIFDGQESLGRTVSLQTQEWWDQQSAAAKEVFTDPNRTSLPIALDRFFQWVGTSRAEMWAHGADFDCVILASAYASCGMVPPWKFRDNRCYRTLKNVIPLHVGDGVPRSGIHHNALDDAIHQAVIAGRILNRLREEVPA